MALSSRDVSASLVVRTELSRGCAVASGVSGACGTARPGKLLTNRAPDVAISAIKMADEPIFRPLRGDLSDKVTYQYLFKG